MESLGQRIAHFRKKAGISQKKLAEVIGMSPTALSYYETNKREPNILILMKLAEALKVTGDALLGLDPHPDQIAQNRDECDLLRTFRGLNSLGQERALEIVSGLGELPRYGGCEGG